MIRYIVDKEKKHLDELLVHLRAHNQSFTGEKTKEQQYVYVLKNDQLLGGMLLNFSWDWTQIRNLFYKDQEVLKELLGKACQMFKNKAVGLNIYTKDQGISKDFVELGFLLRGETQVSKGRGLTYYLELRDLNIKRTHSFHTISSKDIVNEYDIIMKEENKSYKKKFNILGVQEEIHYVAMDEDTFVGGIYLQLYTDSMYIDLLAVNKEYKGNRVGTKLMEYAEKVARERNFVSIDVGTTEFQARPFYEKCGYEVYLTQQDLPKGYECYSLIKRLANK